MEIPKIESQEPLRSLCTLKRYSGWICLPTRDINIVCGISPSGFVFPELDLPATSCRDRRRGRQIDLSLGPSLSVP